MQLGRLLLNNCAQPEDLLKQSLPLSYLALSAVSTDGGSHSVQLYTDISGEWVSGDSKVLVKWNTTTGDTITHEIQRQNPLKFNEINDHTECQWSVHCD
jgi:hypothetical protein